MSEPKSKNLVWHAANVTHQERERLRGQKGCVIWLTGFSASGKSTIARRVEELLLQQGFAAYALDGDNFRTELNRDLGFSPEDRKE
ncbi:MAG: adenylyl-sulfate kinase, partial [Proteobacteria bacterium]|nr:adenylyl-sulfate kinase [Pseudomonadota bacterium]